MVGKGLDKSYRQDNPEMFPHTFASRDILLYSRNASCTSFPQGLKLNWTQTFGHGLDTGMIGKTHQRQQ